MLSSLLFPDPTLITAWPSFWAAYICGVKTWAPSLKRSGEFVSPKPAGKILCLSPSFDSVSRYHLITWPVLCELPKVYRSDGQKQMLHSNWVIWEEFCLDSSSSNKNSRLGGSNSRSILSYSSEDQEVPDAGPGWFSVWFADLAVSSQVEEVISLGSLLQDAQSHLTAFTLAA